MKGYSILESVAFILLLVGGLNWGLVGILQFNLVDMVLGAGSLLTKIVYGAVGVSALYMAFIAITKK